MPEPETQTTNYYRLLGLNPTVSVQEIRRAYRDLSKLYHPDTTQLPAAIATQKFQQLNEAYATLSNPQRRLTYDHKIGYSRLSVMQAPVDLNVPVSEAQKYKSSNAYLDPTDRPLSAGELFALFILGITFIACLVLVVAIGMTQGDIAWRLPADFMVKERVEKQMGIETPLSNDFSIKERVEKQVGIETPLESLPLLEDSPLPLEDSPPSFLDTPFDRKKTKDLPSVINQSKSSIDQSISSGQTDGSNQILNQIQD